MRFEKSFGAPTNILCQAKGLKTLYWNSFYYMESIDIRESFLDGRIMVNQPISRFSLVFPMISHPLLSNPGAEM
jgi:hypothetical protein